MPEADKKPILQPIDGQPSGLNLANVKNKNNLPKMFNFKVIITIAAILLSTFLAVVIIFLIELSPVGGDTELKKITITSGSTLSDIGKQLKDESIIRSSIAFDTYVRIIGKKNNLQSGTYRLSSSESTKQIVEHILKGSVDTFDITFFPGGTLVDNSSNATDKKYDITTILRRAGYTDEEISAGLSQTYDTVNDKLLFANKPVGSDLEGYIYGQTYKFNVGASVHDVLQATLDEFYKQIEDNNLIEKFSSHGLSLFQGITLASIIQREAGGAQAQKQIAQVFYLRLDLGMSLGSDVTYQYIADKTGVPRATNIDSPYNLRVHTGLTPGPISSPGLSALQAVADPAEGDYLYFLAGDDGTVHYARTEAEHEANIVNYCKIACSTL